MKIFGTKRDCPKIGMRKVHNEVLYNLYCTSNFIRIIETEIETAKLYSMYGEAEKRTTQNPVI